MGEAGKAFWFVVFALIVAWFVWLLTGGPGSDRAQGGPFLKPPNPLNTGETYGGNFSFFGKNTQQEKPTSPFADTVAISSALGGKESDPNKEYMEIQASPWNKNTIVVTGWSLKNSSGKTIKIAGASNIPKQGAVNQETLIALEPGDRLAVITGRSPLGVSFRENVCSGYLEQFQDFYPSIPIACPNPSVDLAEKNLSGESACVSFIAGVRTCEKPSTGFPGNISNACVLYAENDLNYNGCISLHKNDRFFFKDRWRFYAGENSEIWGNKGGIVRLYDTDNKLVDSFVY